MKRTTLLLLLCIPLAGCLVSTESLAVRDAISEAAIKDLASGRAEAKRWAMQILEADKKRHEADIHKAYVTQMAAERDEVGDGADGLTISDVLILTAARDVRKAQARERRSRLAEKQSETLAKFTRGILTIQEDAATDKAIDLERSNLFIGMFADFTSTVDSMIQMLEDQAAAADKETEDELEEVAESEDLGMSPIGDFVEGRGN